MAGLTRVFYAADGRPRTAKLPVLFAAIIVIAVGFVGLMVALPKGWIVAVDLVTAHILTFLLRLLGAEVTAYGRTLSLTYGGRVHSMLIGYGCDGVLAYLMLASAILPFPTSWRKRWIGLGAGLAYVVVINQVRLLGLTAVLVFMNDPSKFDFYHLAVGQVFVLVLLFVFLDQWILRLAMPRRVKAVEVAGDVTEGGEAPDGNSC